MPPYLSCWETKLPPEGPGGTLGDLRDPFENLENEPCWTRRLNDDKFHFPLERRGSAAPRPFESAGDQVDRWTLFDRRAGTFAMSDDELEEGEIDEFGRHPPPLPRADSGFEPNELEQDENDQPLGDDNDRPPSLDDTLAGKSWGDLISLLQNDPAGINLHTGLTFDEVAKELEARLQSLAADGDPLMLYIRRMAATVKKMPMAPVLCLLMSAVNMTLRLRRYNISTSIDGEKSVPFRGYSADFDAPCGWSGGGKSILLECLGAPLIQSVSVCAYHHCVRVIPSHAIPARMPLGARVGVRVHARLSYEACTHAHGERVREREREEGERE